MNLQVLNKFIRVGELSVLDHQGEIHVFGSGMPQSQIRFNRANTLSYIMRNPALNIGEAYIQGMWDVPPGRTLHELMTLLRMNFDARLKPRKSLRWLQILPIMLSTWNSLNASRRNIAHHYDLDEDLFRVCLDQEMHYSCAYFTRSDKSLEEAQLAKSAHIAAKLNLQPGQRVLDIGCGWGSLAIDIAQTANCEVTGITLSENQFNYCKKKAKELNLENQVTFKLIDYRQLDEKFDRIVSVGMFEHVGRKFYKNFFKKIDKLLNDDGVSLVHTIGSVNPPRDPHPWITKYIFPGGYTPSLSEVVKPVEKAGLIVSDIEVLKLHYSHTLRHWKENCIKNKIQIINMFDEKFFRMWEFYLASCESAFKWGDQVVYQFQLTKNYISTPTTRDYIYK